MSNKPRRATRQESTARTRETLLDAAGEVFVRRGYHAASIYEIAETAGYTIGALYSHFGSKEGVFLALLDRHFAEQLKRFADEVADDDGRDTLARGGEFWTSFLKRDRALVVLFVEFWAAAVRDPKLARRLARSLRKLRAALASLIEAQASTAGISVAASPTEAAIVFDALIDGFALHKLADPAGVPDGLIGQALAWMASGMTSGGPGAQPHATARR